jgi:hypothetical protein
MPVTTVRSEVAKFLKGKDAGPLAAVALELAKRLDDPDEKSPAPVAKELRATLDAVAEKAADKEATVDPLAAARAKRAQRKAGAAG